jgi:tetratricopeptide (TPR) repeat protein
MRYPAAQPRPFPAAMLAACLLTAAPAAALPAEGEPWIQLRAPHFTLFSNAGEARARQIAEDFERLTSALTALDPELERFASTPTWIYLFESPRDFRDYRLRGSRAEGRGGDAYFLSAPLGTYVAMAGDPRRHEAGDVYHQFLQAALTRARPDLPLWLREGLADFYGSFQVSRGELVVGLPNADHVLWLRKNRMVPLPDLLAAGDGSGDDADWRRRSIHQAQSWALVHFLLAGRPEGPRQVRTYLQELREGAPAAEAFERVLGDVDLLERELRAYVQGELFQVRRQPAPEVSLEASPLSRPDALVRLGELLLHASGERLGPAEEHFRAALEEDPRHGTARAGLGRVAQADGRWAEARQHYEEAARLAPDDFFVHYLLGVSLLEPAPAPESLPRAVAALRRSVALRPDFADGWGRLALALAESGERPADAVEVYETALRMNPGREDVAFNLAMLHAEAGRRERAQGIVETVIVPSGRADLLARAREGLVIAEKNEIERTLVGTGKLAEAVERLEALLLTVEDPERRAALERRLVELRGAAETRRVEDLWNRAVDLLNAGKDAEARPLLEELAANTLNRYLADQARKELEGMGGEPKKQP